MPLTPISAGERQGSSFISIDKQKRLSFSRQLMRELRLSAGLQTVVLAIDVENKRVGVVRQDLAKVPNVNAFKVDKRGYTSGRAVLSKLAIDDAQLPIRFVDAGFEDTQQGRFRIFELRTNANA
jgi:hypothetical protein